MYVLNRAEIRNAMARKRIRSLADLADRIGVHRNTVGRYFSRGEAVLPESISRVLDELELDPGRAIRRISKNDATNSAEKAAIMIVDQLVERNPKAAYVLFGSRARNTARRYSDIDIGVYSRTGMSMDEYLALLEIKERCEQDLPWFVDLVNLNNADVAFVDSISPDLRFLGGRRGDWEALRELPHGRQH